MDSDKKTDIVKEYIKAYNSFDIEKMLLNLSEDVRFKNIENGIVTVDIEGIEEFKKIALETIELFIKREQEILELEVLESMVVVYINFSATLSIDLNEKIKKRDSFSIGGKSIFTFRDNKICAVEDFS